MSSMYAFPLLMSSLCAASLVFLSTPASAVSGGTKKAAPAKGSKTGESDAKEPVDVNAEEPVLQSEEASKAEDPAADQVSDPAKDSAASAEKSGATSDGRGFYLRMTGGPGHTWSRAGSTGTQPDLSLNGWTGNLMLHPGYTFLPGLAVHADLYAGTSFANQVVSDDGSSAYVSNNAGILMYTAGLGMTYHSLPADLYVSAGAGLTYAWATQWTEVADGNGSTTVTSEGATTNLGYGAHGSVGKLFPVHPRWSLGGSLNYNFQSFGRREDSALSIESAHTLWLGFSATFRPLSE